MKFPESIEDGIMGAVLSSPLIVVLYNNPYVRGLGVLWGIIGWVLVFRMIRTWKPKDEPPKHEGRDLEDNIDPLLQDMEFDE